MKSHRILPLLVLIAVSAMAFPAIAQVCQPETDGSACRPVTCPNPGDECRPTCLKSDPVTGDILVIDCECLPADACHIVPQDGVYSPCIQPDNGTGTSDLPPVGCEYQSPLEVWMIIEGLPPGTTMELDGPIRNFTNIFTAPGGSLGGEVEQFDAVLDVIVTGTGMLAGFSRHLVIPLEMETHSAPRNPGDPVQTFAALVQSMQGELFGDPDFCVFRIRGGNALGLPSPGQTTLTELPSGDYAVESFFDITYEIEFEGCPGSVLEDLAGVTTATIRVNAGTLTPSCAGDCMQPDVCELLRVVQPDGTIDFCCECEELTCEPTPDGSACRLGTCLGMSEECQPVTVHVDPVGGTSTILECACVEQGDCHIVEQNGTWDPCTTPDNGSGTADLPPLGCRYESPLEYWMIIDGLPPGTTMELDGPLEDFIVQSSGTGGTLGGEFQIFDATLDVDVTGTGDLAGFNRHLAIPVSIETHTAPRVPGAPVQTFAATVFSLDGELFGDPDFCMFRIRGGIDYGLPSPGEITLRELPSGDYAVESFFDITYQIEFEGCPGSQLEDLMGTTTATIRVNMGVLTPFCSGGCDPGEACELLAIVNADNTIDYSCQCIPIVCEPTIDSSACRTGTCMDVDDECKPTCLTYDPVSGEVLVSECECSEQGVCYIQNTGTSWTPCTVPDNGFGTADIPPVGCDYESPEEVWMIIDGLPPGTTCELDGPIGNFFNITRFPGGSLGGEVQVYEAQLDVDVTGTGDLAGFNRHLVIPISIESHSAPRTPGDPIQNFATDMFSLEGELFGDPDFCLFRIRGGTAFGLPSPGEMTLTELPSGDFAVESFFDVTYQIEFEGCPGSQLDGYAGTTTATINIRNGLFRPVCAGQCDPPHDCNLTETVTIDGRIEFCCACESECDAVVGDVNNSGGGTPIDIDDVVYLIAYIFNGGPDPTPYTVASGDANCQCAVDIDDVVYLITFIFSGGPEPCTCLEWVTLCGSLH